MRCKQNLFHVFVVYIFVAGVAGQAYSAASLNLNNALSDIKAKLNSGQTANMIVFGDSLSFKSNSSYLPTFRDLMQNQYGDAGKGYQGFSWWSGAGLNQGWLKQGINIDMEPHHSLDGLWEQSSLAPYAISGQHNTATFTPWQRNGELHYLQQPGGGSFEIYELNEAGQSVYQQTISTDGAQEQVVTWSHTFSDGYDKYKFIPQGDGMVTILGKNNITDDPGLRIHRAANGGWGVGNFLQRDDTFEQQIDLLNPDLMMLWMGINNGAYTREIMVEQLNLLVDRLSAAAPEAEFVLVTTFDVGGEALADRMAALEDVAAARGLGLINLLDTAGDHEFFLDQGYLVEGNVHPTEAGGEYFGKFLYEAIDTEGVSLDPLQADANYDNTVDLLDLDILGQNFNMSTGAMYSDGDFNGDGAVGLLDLDILGNYWNYTRPIPPSPIPEPTSLIMLSIITVGATARRKR